MARRRTGRRNTKALNARLDCELDTDLISWLEALPSGRRSEAIRDVLRMGLRTDNLRDELERIMSFKTDTMYQRMRSMVGNLIGVALENKEAVRQHFLQLQKEHLSLKQASV